MICNQLYLLSVVLLVLIVSSESVPKPEADDLPIHRIPTEKDSLHHAHFNGAEHNAQYDHEAFLGEDEAKSFDELLPDESKRRLGVIVDRIDQDNDGKLNLSELRQWILYTQRRYIDDDVAKLWRQHNPDDNDTISWDTYRKNVYGFMDTLDKEEIELEENGISYKSMMKRDRRRWGVADQDLDDSLNRAEFTAFLHPEDNPVMKDVVLTETIEDIDKDRDGKVSVEEYIADMYRSSEPDDEEPEWVKNEREAFSKFRDTDGDGFLDREEVRAWVVPQDFDHADSEAKHLIFEADQDGDELLTKEEVLEKYDVFVGSQATDFGEALARHDEF